MNNIVKTCALSIVVLFLHAAKTPTPETYTPQLVAVPGGSFEYGDGVNFPKKQQEVQSFQIGKYEVTQKEWRLIMGKIPAGIPVCDECPVGKVTQEQALKFLKKLSKKTGKTFRLPTQEEWEFAAKGGIRSKHTLYSGSDEEAEVGWVYSNADAAQPVGKRLSNELGLFDMTGNVREWTASPYEGSQSVSYLRGGSFRYSQHLSTNTWRDWLGNKYTDIDIGFRYAADATKP